MRFVISVGRVTALQGLCVSILFTGLLALSPPGSAANEVDDSYHGSWTLRCENTGTPNVKSCIMFQNLVLKTGGQTVLQFAIGIAPADGTPTVLLSLPLGISLPPGITIRIDDGKAANFPVERCEPDGCQAGMKLRETTIEQLRVGQLVEITFYDGQREPIRMPLSLNGFGAGFAALRVASGSATPESAPH